ncbi:MAG: cupin domain-containing protein [Verrucomicrobiota bacterium]|jgi:mannose-6-phosphate isomerase-like protein (cupin superfamily)|nr:cupin domain-containing protein [Verrucomicrobiota bacterium]
MNKQSELILTRVRELRGILELSPDAVAEKIGIPAAQYRAYEDGAESMPIGVLYELAEAFQVDVTALLTGESPRMEAYTVVRAGEGAHVERFPGYRFESLASNFIHRHMEPLLVTVSPDQKEDEKASRVTHHGQEFNLVMEGSIRVELGRHSFVLHKGDSIYFDSQTPHRQLAEGAPATFLTVIEN